MMADPGAADPTGNPENEHLVYELETSDTSSVGLVLRTIYDGDEHQKFMDRLDARIRNHDRDIERMCNFHYQGFIESIRELLQVRNQVQRLKSEISHIDGELQKSAAGLLEQGKDLVKYRNVQSNISAAVESLSLCLPVLEMYSKLKKQMREKRYYPALKTLEQLEHTYLPRVANYRFSQQMRDNIPLLRNSIKEASIKELKEFLDTARNVAPNVGVIAMKQAAEQNNMDPDIIVRRSVAPATTNPFEEDVVNEFEASERSPQDLIDFSPVYRCLHIYSVLSLREKFESYYREQRKIQSKLVLQPPADMHKSVEGYQEYLLNVVGFFVLENQIMNTADGLITKAHLDELWETALSKIISSLKTDLAYCTNMDIMLKVKNLIIVFNHTLKGYGYSMTRLYDLQLDLYHQYTEILMKNWENVFWEIFKLDNYHPIVIGREITEEEQNSEKLQELLAEFEADYRKVLDDFPYCDDSLDKMPFPRRFPFSSFVPKVYCEVKLYIFDCLKFLEDLDLSQTEADSMVRKATNLLLTKTLATSLSALIQNKSLALQQLIQISINTNYLQEANSHLEDFISTTTGISHNGSHVARLQGHAMFKDTRSDAEEQIYEKLKTQTNEFLNLACYDWMLPQSKGQASSYFLDLIAFLHSTFQSFTNLPIRVAQTACLRSCKHISQWLMNTLMDKQVKQVSKGALEHFNLDVIQCELFAASEPVKGFEEGDLLMCFAEIRQLLDLSVNRDWSTYVAEYGQENGKYLRVSLQTAMALLEKMKEGEKKSVFAKLKKTDRDKQRVLDTALKKLKELTAKENS